MKLKLWIIGIIAALTAWGLLTVYSKRAECGWCPGFRCWSSDACGQGCVCITGPGESSGYCYGIK